MTFNTSYDALIRIILYLNQNHESLLLTVFTKDLLEAVKNLARNIIFSREEGGGGLEGIKVKSRLLKDFLCLPECLICLSRIDKAGRLA